MLTLRWTYPARAALTQWYGHVDYLGDYVVGQWFALDADTGVELWARGFFRATTIRGYADGIIVASETRSDGPWTCDFGIYGIDAKTGKLLWVNHGNGIWGGLLRSLDWIGGYTNGLRDSPSRLVDQYVFTIGKRILDVRTGRECRSAPVVNAAPEERSSSAHWFYDKKWIELDGVTVSGEGHGAQFTLTGHEESQREIWRFVAADRGMHVDGNFYSYRLVGNRIFILLGDAPKVVPIDPKQPFVVKPNPANYQVGILDVATGQCVMHPLVEAKQRTECRIEAVRESRILVSCDERFLAEYEVSQSRF